MAAIDALAFWVRRQGTFWMLALPIAGLAAAIAYVFTTNRQLAEWRDHWGWDLLFALIYAMFLDRWIKEVLLDGASPCEEVDDLRRSTVAVRFLIFVLALFGLAMALSEIPLPLVGGVLWAAIASVFVLLLPSLSAAWPLSLRQAFSLGRPVQGRLFLLIAGAAILSLLADTAAVWALEILPPRVWAPAAVAGATRFIDCVLLAFVGYGLATIYRDRSGWLQPEPAERPYRGTRWRKV